MPAYIDVYKRQAYLYHLRNIISVPENAGRVKYHNVCLFLDEIELCFHPEYQRLFVANLSLIHIYDTKVTPYADWGDYEIKSYFCR